ncbi:MAG: iron ABC transporter permease [Phenylobacterium sp.]|uniref:FecCD family ABC transporter permease n=1 Tax=Phenylobacterium sp. TaxID=1871053 RepID=UPI0027332D48|nr:iron ABC transporter permease [Phenylobacterium sp.]MDP3747104.1 iron ABC transporter permease [Phenylobacterium sp.]
MRRLTVLAALVALGVVLSLVSMAAGRVWVPLSDWTDPSDPRWAIVFELRLPRTLLCVAVGAALGMSGAAMQGYTRNPLADPGALGVSAMAALGAVLTLYLGAGASQPWMIAAAAMAGALIAVLLLLALSGSASSIVTFILAGVILQTVAGAGVALALSLAPNPWAVNEIVNWLMGSLADRSMAEVQMALPLIAVGCGLLLLIGRGLDALTLGETGARSLGINMTATRWLLAIGVALTAGASVAVTGVIGFVGLIVPHLLRPLVGARPGGLLIPSAIGGAVLVLAADIAVRLTPAAGEVKLGVAMAVLGGPFFFALLLSLRKRIA